MSGFGEGLGPGGHFSGFLFQLGEFFTALKRSLREGRDEHTDQPDTTKMRFLPRGHLDLELLHKLTKSRQFR